MVWAVRTSEHKHPIYRVYILALGTYHHEYRNWEATIRHIGRAGLDMTASKNGHVGETSTRPRSHQT
jgi:hypothetical protein